jgi:predicted DNA-binding helix-hairpin-helix protein
MDEAKPTALPWNSRMSLADFVSLYVTDKLTIRERQFTMLRHKDVFGLGVNEKTYREIAETEGCSAVRVGQVIRKARCKVNYKLHMIAERMKEPHVIIRHVCDEMKRANLPMRQKLVSDLGPLSVRLHNCLHNEKLLQVDLLLEKRPSELLRVPNFGRKSLRELVLLLEQHGLSLSKETWAVRSV